MTEVLRRSNSSVQRQLPTKKTSTSSVVLIAFASPNQSLALIQKKKDSRSYAVLRAYGLCSGPTICHWSSGELRSRSRFGTRYYPFRQDIQKAIDGWLTRLGSPVRRELLQTLAAPIRWHISSPATASSGQTENLAAIAGGSKPSVSYSIKKARKINCHRLGDKPLHRVPLQPERPVADFMLIVTGVLAKSLGLTKMCEKRPPSSSGPGRWTLSPETVVRIC